MLDIVRPLAPVLPEVELPDAVVFDDKMLYTASAAALYLIAALPIYGVLPQKLADPFYWARGVVASDRGTLLELGVLPVATSAFFWQFLAGSRVVKVNFANSSERKRFQSLQKATALFLGLLYSVVLVLAGYFDSVDSFKPRSLWSQGLIVAQLAAANGVVTYLCEILEKGHGYGPGVMAFTAIHAATKIAGAIAGFVPSALSQNGKVESVVIQLASNFLSSPIKTVYNAFTRSDEINLTQIYLTIVVVLGVMYLSNFRHEVSIKSSKVRSMVSTYPIRLLYCGPLSLIFTWLIIYHLNFVAYLLNQFVGPIPLLAQYDLDVHTNKLNLTSGLLYLLCPVYSSQAGFILNVVRPFALIGFFFIVAVFFGSQWFNLSGSSGKDLAKQFKDQEISLVGFRDGSKELNKLISSASITGCILLGLGVSLGDVFGGDGFVSSVVVGFLGAMGVLENVMADLQQNGAAGSQFGQVFGQN